ncbi:MAG: hypothetical protein HFJ29_06890 [Clostridia bacterium]|nr:hypothetical protein [Clostridia bacterium]
MRYRIFYEDIEIGMLEISADGNQHKYTPNPDGIALVEDHAPLTRKMVEGTNGWEPAIPFFRNRIEDAKRFSHDECITKHTDNIRMIREDGEQAFPKPL